MSQEKLVAVGKSGVYLLDSKGKKEETISPDQFVTHPNGCVLSQNQLCVSLSEKAKLVFISSNQVFRASVPELMTSVEFSVGGELLYCGSSSGKLYIYQIRSGNLVFLEQIFYNEITDLKTDERNYSLLISSSKGDICLLRLSQIFTNRKTNSNFLGHSCHVLSVCNLLFGVFSRDLSFLSVSRDRNLRLWHKESVNSLKSFYLNSNPLKIYQGRLGIECYVTCEDGNLVTVNLKNFEINYHKFHQGPICAFVEMDNLISCGLDGFKVWDKNNKCLLFQYQTNLNVFHLFKVASFPKCNFKFKLLKVNKQHDQYTLPVFL